MIILFLITDSVKNLMRYKERYIVSGLLLTIMSFVCVVSVNMYLYYGQVLEKALNNDFILLPPNDVQMRINTVLRNRISTFDFTIKVIIVAGLLVIAYNTIMSINERKYDIGVLRSMGMSKVKTSLYLVVEIGLYVFGAVILGTVPAFVFAKNVMFKLDSDFFEISRFVSVQSVLDFTLVMQIISVTAVAALLPMLGITAYVLSFSPRNLLSDKKI